jgi:hypothetical protein
MAERTWKRVTTAEKCPICGKPDYCTRSGGLVLCMRVESPKPSTNRLGGWLHRIGDDTETTLTTLEKKPKPVIDWTTLARTMFESPTAAEERNYLAQTLGVSEAALVELGVGRGWDVYRSLPYSSWPERDAKGSVVGIVRRYRDGAKKTMRHSSHGIYFAAPLMRMRLGPVFCVEGGSDTAALLTLGVNVVGRPSNLGGVDQLVQMARSISRYTRWIVVGERDEKPDGRWPGKQGAVTTAERMTEQLQRRVKWIMPPAKDVRAWLNQTGTMSGPDFLKAVQAW